MMLIELYITLFSETNSGDSSVSSSPSHSARFSTWAPEKFSIISWNLDGLDDKNLEKRTEAVLGQIIRFNFYPYKLKSSKLH